MKVSVIMGVYNDLETVGAAIESILNQTFKDFEFIICNDCSTNNVGEILEEYAQKDSRIVLVNNEQNIGLAGSLNKCLAIAHGEYIARMDSDDISLPSRFEEQVNFLDNNQDYAVCGTNAIVFDENGKERKTSGSGEIDLDTVFKAGGFMHPTVMMRKGALLDVDGYTVNQTTLRCEDYDLWNKLYQKGYKGYVMPDILFRYRETTTNINKRKFKHYVDRAKISLYWKKKHNLSFKYYIWCLRPILVGMMPKWLYKKVHK